MVEPRDDYVSEAEFEKDRRAQWQDEGEGAVNVETTEDEIEAVTDDESKRSYLDIMRHRVMRKRWLQNAAREEILAVLHTWSPSATDVERLESRDAAGYTWSTCEIRSALVVAATDAWSAVERAFDRNGDGLKATSDEFRQLKHNDAERIGLRISLDEMAWSIAVENGVDVGQARKAIEKTIENLQANADRGPHFKCRTTQGVKDYEEVVVPGSDDARSIFLDTNRQLIGGVEIGPEAILPLERGPDGKLGVRRINVRQRRRSTDKPESILDEASKLVNGDRASDYGDMVENWTRIAKMMSAYLGVEITARNAADLMSIVKLSRSANKAKRDNYVDLAGYAHVANVCAEAEERA